MHQGGRQADFWRIWFTGRSGGLKTPTRFPEFFRRLQSKGGTLPAALTIISTHPGHEERDQALQAQFHTLPAATYEPIGVDWAGLKAALAGAEAVR